VSATFERARQNSWVMATALEAAGPSSERLRIGAFIERRAASAGCSILRHRYAPAASLASLYGAGAYAEATAAVPTVTAIWRRHEDVVHCR
jgi:hypothetical protein